MTGRSGNLSAVIPGGQRFPMCPGEGTDSPGSRVCEQTWLEPALFDRGGTDEIVVLFEELLPVVKSLLGSHVSPGTLGEQMVIRGVDPSVIRDGSELAVGDAVLAVTAPPDLTLPDTVSMSSIELIATIPHFRAVICEEGLVEPGSPVVVRG